MPRPTVHRFFANRDNLLPAAEATVSSVKPAANTVRRVGVSGEGEGDTPQGSGRVTVGGSYTGAEDLDLLIRVAGSVGTVVRHSAPVFVGSGNGVLSDIAIAPGTDPQEYTLRLADTGTETEAAAVAEFGVTLRARQTGADGNDIRLTADASALTITPTGNALLDEIPAGSDRQPARLVGEQWRVAADIYPLSPKGELHPDTARLKFGDFPTVHRMWSARENGETVYYLDPPPPKPIPRSTAAYAVTGTYSVTVTDGVTPEVLTGITTLYDLLQAIGRESEHIRVEGVVTADRTPGGMAVEDLPLRTAAYASESSGSGSEHASGLESITVPEDAPTQTVTAECVSQPVAGDERWKVTGTSSGAMGTAITGQAYTHADMEFTIPARYRSGAMEFALAGMSRESGNDSPKLDSIVCIERRHLGVKATSQKLTLTYVIPEAAPCYLCDDSNTLGSLIPEYLGLDSLDVDPIIIPPAPAPLRDFDSEIRADLTLLQILESGGETWMALFHQAALYEAVQGKDYFIYGDAYQPYMTPSVSTLVASSRAVALFSTHAEVTAFQEALAAKFAPLETEAGYKGIGFTVPAADMTETIVGDSIIEWDIVIRNATMQAVIKQNTPMGDAHALTTDKTYTVHASIPVSIPYGGYPDKKGYPTWLASTVGVDSKINGSITNSIELLPEYHTDKHTFDSYMDRWGSLTEAVNAYLGDNYRVYVTPIGVTGAFGYDRPGARQQRPGWPMKGGGVFDYRKDDYVAPELIKLPFRAVIAEAAELLPIAFAFKTVMAAWRVLWDHIHGEVDEVLADTIDGDDPDIRDRYADEFDAVQDAIDALGETVEFDLWADLEGPYWRITSDRSSAPKYPEAYTNRWYHGCYFAEDGTITPSQEFAFVIQVAAACVSQLRNGDQIHLEITGREAYRVGDKLQVDTIAANPLYLDGGRTGNNTHTWSVRGSADGILPEYANVLGSEAVYNQSGLQFKIVRGAIAFALNSEFRFSAESGQWEYSTDDGETWSTPADIDSGDLALEAGLSARFEPGAGQSWAPGDQWTFQAMQPYAPSHVLTPGTEGWEWSGASATATYDLGEDTEIAALGCMRHRLPAGAVLTVEGLSAADAVLWTQVLPYRRGPMLAEFTAPQTARKLRYSVASATGGSIAWLWAGAAVKTTFPLTTCQQIYTAAWAAGGGLNPARRLLGRGTGYDVSWDWLSQVDWEGLRAMLDSLADSGDIQDLVVFAPSIYHPADASLVLIEMDSITVTDQMAYGPRNSAHRRLSVSFAMRAVLA